MPSPTSALSESSFSYWGRNTPDYWNERFGGETNRSWEGAGGPRQTERHMRESLEFLDDLEIDLAGKRVLDIGCAMGEGTAMLAERGAEAVGADFSTNAIEVARRRFPEPRFVAWDIRQIPETFDLIISNHTLEHLGADIDTAMAELLRASPLVCVNVPGGNRPVDAKKEHVGPCNDVLAEFDPEVKRGSLYLFERS